MDSQGNNSFGSFGSNTSSSGQSMSSDTAGSIISSGATAVDSNNYVSSEFPKGGLSVGGDSNSRSRKGLIFGIIVIIILLIGCGFGVYVWANGMFSKKNNSDNVSQDIGMVALKDAFNIYVNYIVSGEDNNSDVTGLEIENLYSPYFLQIDKDKRTNYVKNVETKFTTLSESLKGKYEIELYDADLYFRWFASVYPIGLSDAEKMYLADGYEKARELVNKHYDVRIVSSVFETYMRKAQDLALYELEIVSKADKSGCIADGAVKKDCYVMTEEEKNNYEKKMMAQNEYESILRKNGVSGIKVIYDYVYDMNGGDNV